MTTTSNISDPRAIRWGTFAKYAMLLVVGFAVAPFIWIALGGLLGLIVAALVMIAAWMLRPWVFTKAANIRISLIKHEAAKNPVPTLQENLRKEMASLDERKTKIEKLNGAIRNFKTQTREIADKYGENDPSFVQMSKDIVDLERVYVDRCNKWNKAARELKRFAEEIEKAEMIWEAAQAAAAAREASGLTSEAWETELKTKTALDSIQSSYNDALASLDTSMLEEAPQRTAHEERTPPPLAAKA